jgi:hypothetical protein
MDDGADVMIDEGLSKRLAVADIANDERDGFATDRLDTLDDISAAVRQIVETDYVVTCGHKRHRDMAADISCDACQ